MNISTNLKPQLSTLRKAKLPAADKPLPRPDQWEISEKKGSWVKGHDALTYRRTMSNVGAAAGAFASHFVMLGAGVALGASTGAMLGNISWPLGIAGAIAGGLGGGYVGAKLQGSTMWGRSLLTKAGATAGNLVGRGMHALKVPLRSNHVETAERFSIKSLNRYGADMLHSGHDKISETEADQLIEKLQPGDVILTGDNRSTPIATATHIMTGRSNFTHAIIYKGEDRAIEAVMGGGVIENSMKTILTGKHHAVAIRPDYEEGQGQKAVEFSEKLVGKPYDYKFSNGNETWYCSEAVYAAVTDAAPQVEFDTRKILGHEIVVPNDLFYSEDVGVIGEVGTGRTSLDRMMGKFIAPSGEES